MRHADERDQAGPDRSHHRAVHPDRSGERVEVMRDGLARRDGDRVAGPQLVAHRALGENDAGQHGKQGDACAVCSAVSLQPCR